MVLNIINPNDLLTTGQAASLLKLAPGTLQNWRTQGIGPEFIKRRNNVFYPKEAILEFLDRHSRRYKSTKEWKEQMK